MNKLKYILTFIFILILNILQGQNLSLYQQFNGRFNYTMIGNTHNTQENSFQSTPQTILTSTTAILNIKSQSTGSNRESFSLLGWLWYRRF